MKIIIKNVVLLLVAVFLFSCSEEENNAASDASFFNLNVGNKWVYKKYENSTNNPTVFTFNGIIDTVKIVEQVNLSGFTFAKKLTKRTNSNTNTVVSERTSYVRVNDLGHLIEIGEDELNYIEETYGLVLHPGLDFTYMYYDTRPYGETLYKLYGQTAMNVEGVDYSIVPYNGVFTPADTSPDLVSKTVENNYQENVGLVKLVCHGVASNYSWEERLVYYEIVD